VELPSAFATHINLKQVFDDQRREKPMGMALEGRHHRGIDDARNIAKLAQRILPRLDAEP
jgi:inhibitor of KinA sporulation pathway (predicted exonuclease)